MNKKIVIIEGPSAVGKDTIINELISRYPERFGKPINATTRPMRENESQNNPYLFITDEEFVKMRQSGEIFEHTIRHGTYRGMRKSSFNEIINSGRIAIRDCDILGLHAIRQEYPDSVLGIFLTAPKDEIKKRLMSRNEPADSMEIRLKDYDIYVENAKYFDYVIENMDINETIQKILDIIEEECWKNTRNFS